jgi:hypothetical protein
MIKGTDFFEFVLAERTFKKVTGRDAYRRLMSDE